MPPIATFTPTFEHEDWIDNVDRVSAGGQNGFNSRFNALRADLNQLTQVIKAVDDALQLRPPAQTVIDTNVTIPAFIGGTGGVIEVTLGALMPITSHAFHQISVRPLPAFLNAPVSWTEVVFVADDLTGGPPKVARMLRLQHTRPSAVTVAVRVLRVEHTA
jgi:hypothetical protein